MARQSDDDWRDFEGIVETETPKAVYFQGDFWPNLEWVPKSQMQILERDTSVVPMRMIVKIKGWICDKNGWE